MAPFFKILLGYLAVFITSYLCGSFPSGLLIGRLNGIDIRKYGSHNIGATNVRRVLGRDWSILCFLLDFLKGFLPVIFLGKTLGSSLGIGAGMGSLVSAIAAVLGHVFPIWLKFRGGKGVATSLGVITGISIIPVLVGGLSWLAIFEWKRIVSLASMGAVIMITVSALVMRIFWPATISWPGIILFAVIAALVIIRHRDNIDRLRNGTEAAFAPPKKTSVPEDIPETEADPEEE